MIEFLLQGIVGIAPERHGGKLDGVASHLVVGARDRIGILVAHKRT
jgi:hypothetical protein